ncbi:hypothetical protein [Pseudonocardia sp. TRM90224]|uniref:hypothetical protein n=1 Tax=Pseudonocardia sp. TRM90224 TaxID=2812678 RepID=UPI001E3CD7DA|nr:hypothetical protein [Pseudonocardia sp. TRM90224]
MSATWEQTHRRQALLKAVLADVEASGQPAVTHLDEVVAEFGDVTAFLLAAHHRWYTAVLARIDVVLEDQQLEPVEAVAEIWTVLAERHAPLRALLDAHRDEPALAAADEHYRGLVLRDLGVDLAALTTTSIPRQRRGWWRGLRQPA